MSKCRLIIPLAWVSILTLVLTFGFASTPAMAAGVEDLGLFELDGNAWDSNGFGTLPDDWDTLYNDQGHQKYFRMLQDVPSNDPNHQIAEGGDKDIDLIEDWGWVYGGALDKGDITDGYAAAYDSSGDLIVYFGADRFGHDGDTFLGFWFFKSNVSPNMDGTFTGSHQQGDVLALVNFPQAANKEPEIKVLEWDPSCDKGVHDPVAGECAGQNLRLVAGATGEGAICHDTTGQGIDDACAITNNENGPNDPTPSPWPYESKYGDVDQFPYETFFEGGINLSALIDGDTCFSSFMAETRSSSSYTAQRKDWLLGEFDLCKITVDKDCTQPRFSEDYTKILYDISGTITNEGYATMYNLAYTDYLWRTDLDPDAYVETPFASFAWDGDPSELAAGTSIGYTAILELPFSQNGFDDKIVVTANTNSDDTGTVKEAFDTADCPTIDVSPALEVTKNCESLIDVVTESTTKVVAQVYVSGTVKNIGDSVDGPIYDVTVNDDKAGSLTLGKTTLLPGEQTTYSGYYYPTTSLDDDNLPTNNPCQVVFKDTVTANGNNIFGGPVAEQTADAKCALCECN